MKQIIAILAIFASTGSAAFAQKPEADIARRAVDRFSSDPAKFIQTDGKKLYETSCQACHMEDGRGAKGAGHHPPLAENAKMVSKYYILSVLVNGYHGMPRFGDQMDDAQVAAVTNYVRENFGKDYTDMIKPADFTGLRPSSAD